MSTCQIALCHYPPQGNWFKETDFSPKQCSVLAVGYDFPSPQFIYLCFNKFWKLRDKVIYVKERERNYCFICVESYRRLKDLDLQIKKRKKEKGKNRKPLNF